MQMASQEVELDDLVPWSKVVIMLETAEEALKAKSSVTALLHEKEQQLEQDTFRAEEDSGSLRDELQTLMRAKAQLVQDKAELRRQHDFLLSERELLCAQLQASGNADDPARHRCAPTGDLVTHRRAAGSPPTHSPPPHPTPPHACPRLPCAQVDPATANLCQAVAVALDGARRAGELGAQLGQAVAQAASLQAQLQLQAELHEAQRAQWAAQQEELWSIMRSDASPPPPPLQPAAAATAWPDAAAPLRLQLPLKPRPQQAEPLGSESFRSWLDSSSSVSAISQALQAARPASDPADGSGACAPDIDALLQQLDFSSPPRLGTTGLSGGAKPAQHALQHSGGGGSGHRLLRRVRGAPGAGAASLQPGTPGLDSVLRHASPCSPSGTDSSAAYCTSHGSDSD
jgi:hypothetical protein